MNHLLCTLCVLAIFSYNLSAQITFRGCTANALGAQDYTLFVSGTTNDAGTIRNTYESTPADFTQSCPAGVCEIRIMWNIGAARWEISLDNDGPVGAPDYTTSCLYFNTSASYPNPPDLTLGTWQDCSGGLCPSSQFTTMSGNVQSTISNCTNPTVPTVTYSPTAICDGNNTTLNISGTLNDATNWHIYSGACGSGTLLGTTAGATFVVTPSFPSSTYHVRGEDGTGCVDEATGACGTVTVTVNAIPSTPSISAGGATTFCTGGSVMLTSSSSTGNQWYLNGSPIGGATNQTYAASGAGNYTVVVTTNNCSSAASSPTSVTVNAIPSTPSISAGGATTFCTGGSVMLTSSSSTGNQWYLNGSPIGGATNQTYAASGAGNYTVVVTTNNCSSAASSPTSVTVNTPVTFSQTLVECAGFSIMVGTNTYSSTGVYNDVLPAANGCDSTVTTDLTVLAPLTGTITQTICAGDSIVVNGTTYNTTVTGATEVFTNIGPNACDSVVTINLTVENPIDNSVDTFSLPTLTSNSTNTTYQWVDCDNNFMALSGATNQAYTPMTSGNYAVIVTQNNCSDTSSCYAVTVTSIKNHELTKILTLYPNPTSGELTMELGKVYNEITINVTNITGQHISSKSYEMTNKIDFEIEGTAGVYLVEVLTEDGDRATMKVLKK